MSSLKVLIYLKTNIKHIPSSNYNITAIKLFSFPTFAFSLSTPVHLADRALHQHLPRSTMCDTRLAIIIRSTQTLKWVHLPLDCIGSEDDDRKHSSFFAPSLHVQLRIPFISNVKYGIIIRHGFVIFYCLNMMGSRCHFMSDKKSEIVNI